jgi:putative serine protease PepD
MGSPLGLSGTVTEGIVSAVNRPVRTGDATANAQTAVLDAVQTDAAINPGNSGGPLVDLNGSVVGINSAIATVSSMTSSESGNIGVGFAIPANDAVDVADQLIATGHATHASLGVSVGDGAGGATLQDVTPGGAADSAGLQAGDVISAVGDRKVTDVDSLIAAVRDHRPGETVRITYTRGGASSTVSVTLGSRTSS